MKKEKSCCCLYAALAAFIVILINTYISGYTMGNWTVATWIAALAIVGTAAFCMQCRQKEDENE